MLEKYHLLTAEEKIILKKLRMSINNKITKINKKKR